MDITARAIALKSTDVKENDKIVLLYSLEYGKISVHAKGVKKSTAKLKFAVDQFCFGNYELAKSGDRYTLKTCEQVESFFELRENIESYYGACVIAECLADFTEEGQSEPNVFVETLYALRELVSAKNPYPAVLKYLLFFLKAEGFALSFDRCSSCGKQSKNMFFEEERDDVVCENCASAGAVAVSARIVSACRLADSLPYDKLRNVKITSDALKEALEVCSQHISKCFYPLKSIKEFIRLI